MHGRPARARCGGRLGDRVPTPQPCPHAQCKTYLAERKGEPERSPRRHSGTSASGNWNEYHIGSEQRRQVPISKATSIDKAGIAGQPEWVARLHAVAQLARGLRQPALPARRIDVTRHERHAGEWQGYVPQATLRLRCTMVRARGRPAVTWLQRYLARGLHARFPEPGLKIERRFAAPSSEAATTPPGPGA